MGCYINPPDTSKEKWMNIHGKGPYRKPPEFGSMDGHLLVCLVRNAFFTAAGIMFSHEEYVEFSRSEDQRPKCWFWVPVLLLEKYL